MLATLDGGLLTPQESIAHMAHLLAIPTSTRGSNVENAPLVKLAMRGLKGRLKAPQTRLLMKGEDGLANRIHKVQFDAEKVTSTLLTAALKYGMHIEPEQKPVSPSAPTVENGRKFVRKERKDCRVPQVGLTNQPVKTNVETVRAGTSSGHIKW